MVVRVWSAERLSTSFGAVAAKRKGQAEIFPAILSLRLRAWQSLKGHDHFALWQVLFPLVLSGTGHFGPRQAVIWLRKARRWAQRPLIHHIDRRRAFIPTACRTGRTAESFTRNTPLWQWMCTSVRGLKSVFYVWDSSQKLSEDRTTVRINSDCWKLSDNWQEKKKIYN